VLLLCSSRKGSYLHPPIAALRANLKGVRPIILIKGFLAGAATFGLTIAVLFGLAVGVPRVLELLPPTIEGGVGVWEFGPFSKGWLITAALLIFAGGFYWSLRRSLRTRNTSQNR
jgi:hypothetical protein